MGGGVMATRGGCHDRRQVRHRGGLRGLHAVNGQSFSAALDDLVAVYQELLGQLPGWPHRDRW